MIEVLWHGRGGQGAFTAARLLGAAATMGEGGYALAFPSFGPERRGAPMRAFTKISDAPLGDRSAVTKADYAVYLDETLFAPGWEAELKPGGRVLVNSALPSRAFGDPRVVSIDANGLSKAILGRPIPNTALLGALCVLCAEVRREDVEEAVRHYMAPKLHAKNLAIVAAAVEAMGAAEEELADQPDGAAFDVAELRGAVNPDVTEGFEAAATAVSEAPTRPPVHIPALQNTPLDPAEFARTTCFTAGHLVSKNAGWRNERPVVDAQRCTMCLQCEFHCPDGTIYRTEGENGPCMMVDLDFCKGCGVCVTVCKFGALAMAPEHAQEGGTR